MNIVNACSIFQKRMMVVKIIHDTDCYVNTDAYTTSLDISQHIINFHFVKQRGQMRARRKRHTPVSTTWISHDMELVFFRDS